MEVYSYEERAIKSKKMKKKKRDIFFITVYYGFWRHFPGRYQIFQANGTSFQRQEI